MRVKRLEIQGFKSFKDRTVIHFDHNITGIVGPNGCGKSNIVDAFFWVMGEQSYKHMRGNGSDDLIFNGSSRFSPLGMAEATLVMETVLVDTANAPAGASVGDISEGPDLPVKTKEISVTRRLYRSGEGEYFINGTPSRLKDIHELFMDTGVGAKGYSVIEQGQIGKIVNAKPDDRRLLVEEAAGIAKYKARKKESLRKMEATQANLSRLNDIIQEIEKNLDSLERQAQKARLYKKYKDELFQKEITWGRRKNFVFQEKLQLFRKQKEDLELELAQLRAELQTAENGIEVDRVCLITENKDAELLQAQVQTLAESLSQKRSALDLSRRRQGDLASQLEALETEQVELEEAIASGANRVMEQEAQAEEADGIYQHALSEAQEMNVHLEGLRNETRESRNQLDLAQRQLMSGMSQISHFTSKSAALLSKLESARIQAERLSQQAETQRERLEELQQELEKAKLEAEGLKSRRSELRNEQTEKASLLQAEEQNLRSLEKERDLSLRSATQLKSKLQSLQELEEANEGLADGPKAALEWAKKEGHENKLRALTDLLDVTAGYETVLESWLETQIESLVLQDLDLAYPLLEKVRADKQGRVKLESPLSIRPSSNIESPDILDFEKLRAFLTSRGFKVLGRLDEFARPSAKNLKENGWSEALLKRLVSNVCVVESAALIEKLSPNDPELLGWGLISLEGTAIESDGAIRGGSLNASGIAGILKRKRAIEELIGLVQEADAKLQTLEEQVSQSKQTLDQMKTRQQALQTDLQNLEIQVAALERDIHQTERAYQEARRHSESLEGDIEAANEEVEMAQSERETVQIELEELVATRTQAEEGMALLKTALVENEEKLRIQELELQSVRIREASSRERVMSLKREVEATRSLLQDRERRLSEIRRTLDRTSREQAEFTGSESELAQEIEELTLRLAQCREQFSTVKDRIEQISAQVDRNIELVKGVHKRTESKTSEANQIAIDSERVSGELSHLVLNLEEKYGVGCLTAVVGVPSETDPASEIATEAPAEATVASELAPPELTPEEEIVLGEEVDKLRERIRRLGEVNVMAIEEFELLKKRHDYLVTEKADLERSLENLQDAIEHINKTSEERFKKAFEAIAERFERLFPIVFGGGQAKLSLIYPEGSTDILEAGVDILAQPPGKKVSNITLLSGGEKALTAVSLIFAIFMVKPSPFCVLDEVDAPLDDANIGKFNALLREMSSKSQFILITHNKKTMELNDTLYGVTMEEPGVSKMVSIEMH